MHIIQQSSYTRAPEQWTIKLALMVHSSLLIILLQSNPNDYCLYTAD